jgi:hypothetical protein
VGILILFEYFYNMGKFTTAMPDSSTEDSLLTEASALGKEMTPKHIRFFESLLYGGFVDGAAARYFSDSDAPGQAAVVRDTFEYSVERKVSEQGFTPLQEEFAYRIALHAYSEGQRLSDSLQRCHGVGAPRHFENLIIALGNGQAEPSLPPANQ